MNSKTSASVIRTAFIVLAMPLYLSAQEDQEHSREHHKQSRYKVIDMGTFGGPNSLFSNPSSRVINSQGTATGAADTAMPDPYDPNCFFDCLIDHAFVWKNGVRTDLGTLPRGSSSFAYWVNNRGLIVGQSQNGLIDPLTGFPEANGVLWKQSQIVNLGTLGGNQSNANAINDHDQVVGGALNKLFDPFADSPLIGFGTLGSFAQTYIFTPAATQTHAFLWQDGEMQDLGTLGGPDSNALLLNDSGQVAGVSFVNSIANPSGVPTVDPFVWEQGRMADLGTLGGTFGAPYWLNNRGQVVGLSNLAGDMTYHPFLWTEPGPMHDLGTLGGGHRNRILDQQFRRGGRAGRFGGHRCSATPRDSVEAWQRDGSRDGAG